MRLTSFHIGAAILIASVACTGERSELGDLDSAVRGEASTETWNALPPKVKHLQCLEYKISSMRKLVSTASGPVDFLRYYPHWAEGLAECEIQYPIDKRVAKQMSEAVVTKMETVLGEETSSFLTSQRLNSSHPDKNWLEGWRVFAIVGVAGVSDVLPKRALIPGCQIRFLHAISRRPV